MERTEVDYLQDLTVHLRLAGLDGRTIGGILEETRDHLEASGQKAEDAFGPAAEYAQALAASHGAATPGRRSRFTRAELLAGTAQLAGWLLVFGGLAALAGPGNVRIQPGHLAGLVVLTAGFVWPVWPAFLSYAARRSGILVPTAAMTVVLAGSVALTVVWDTPTLVAVRPWVAIAAGTATVGVCWLRVWRLRDPVRRPTPGAGGRHHDHET